MVTWLKLRIKYMIKSKYLQTSNGPFLLIQKQPVESSLQIRPNFKRNIIRKVAVNPAKRSMFCSPPGTQTGAVVLC